MKREPLFLEPVFKERIWGGDRLQKEFGYDIPSPRTGECWGISAHEHGPSIIKNGPLAGKTLIEAWSRHRDWFGDHPADEFPLLTKILDARTDLSVQVHPNDHYAQKVERVPYGKTECWYVIDCEEGAEIVYGHHADSKETFQAMVEQGVWDKLLRRVKVKPGDFFFVPSGTIHAIGAGIMILETQQSSDITYRVYDYGRRDENGNERELHIDKAIEVTRFPHQNVPLTYEVLRESRAVVTTLVSDKYFTVYHWDVRGHLTRSMDKPFILVSVIKGGGTLVIDDDRYEIKKGDHFIIPSGVWEFEIVGECECIASHT
ncbi:mannose-6-phosphate isomerase, class I [Caenibacillus caldisaponilyticus]|uniref:mannose-6-phosphate isomerase, class I n=1 Tax=Caenibacillus caldisaponilyticus TaxID=1674942 RepID=UPI0009882F78|nr:mannose-6-phosphate isomerase, class I [Caenibacillus caldisaponilyticus]